MLLVLVVVTSLSFLAGGEAPYRGVQLHSLSGDSNVDMDRDLDASRAAGSNVVRADVSWASLEENAKGQFARGYRDRLDRLIDGAKARGMKVIATLWSTPCWASSAPETVKQGCAPGWWNRDVGSYPPRNNADYADISRWMTARYGTKLAALELWNEPNHPLGQFWKATDKAAAYAAMVKAAYPAAKAGNAEVPVLAGALLGSDRTFLTALYAAGMKGFYDGFAVHPYADRGFMQLKLFRSAQQAAADSAPVWATEFGWPTGTSSSWHVSETRQASNIKQAFADLHRLSYVRGATLYNLRDTQANLEDPEANFGVLRHHYSPKPSFEALKDALTGTPCRPWHRTDTCR